MVELLLTAGLVAAGVLTVRAMRRRRDPELEPPPPPAHPDTTVHPPLPEAPAPGECAPREDPPPGLQIGDVLLYADTELWIAGSLAFEEEGLVCHLHRTPGSRRASWLAQLDAEARSLALLQPTEAVPRGRVPDELPFDSHELRLYRRGQARTRARGEHLPPVTDEAIYTWLTGPGGRMLFVVDFARGERLALAGQVVGRELFDLLPAGSETDRP